MSKTNLTKQAIANSMKHLMERVPFDQITTADIIRECGVSRKTFYYHFRDKYDLVNWIFSVEVIDDVVENTSLENLENCYLELCSYIRDNLAFCRNAIGASGQNCVSDFLYHYVSRQVMILCREALSEQKLSEDDVGFLIDYYYSAFLGVLKNWIGADAEEPPAVIVKRWLAVVDQNIEHYISMLHKN